MDATANMITKTGLESLRAAWPGPLLLDLRRDEAYRAGIGTLPGAIRRDPATVTTWAGDLELVRPIVVFCVHGHEVGQNTAAALRARGRAACYLEGGIEGWRGAGGPLAGKPREPSLWVTRERPKIDRVACPWLIRRFIDPDAHFLYVPTAEVMKLAAETGAVPFDMPGAALAHVGDGCSFDTFLDTYRLDDPALRRLAVIVRGADTERPDLAPAAPGLLAVALGLSALLADDDHACLRYGMVVYDALYRWARDLTDERHVWPPAMPQGATPTGAVA